MKVFGISGSMRDGSYGARALGLALESARIHGGETRILDLRISELPMYRPDEPLDSPILREATTMVQWADSFLLASPDYHGSMSGALKNFLDHHWDEFAGKLFGFLCASHEKGITVMQQMRTAVRQCYGWSMPYGVAVHGENDFDPNGDLKNEKVGRRLRMLGRDLVVYGAVLRDQFARDVNSNEPDTFSARYR